MRRFFALSLAMAAALSFAGGWLAGRGHRQRVPDAARDMVTVVKVRVDTVTAVRPQVREVRVADTILVAVRDTVTIRDTLWMELPREVRVYSDSLYRAEVSGWRPSLDLIEVYPRTTVVTRTVAARPGRWSLGVHAGYGATRDGLSPYVGVGLGWSILVW